MTYTRTRTRTRAQAAQECRLYVPNLRVAAAPAAEGFTRLEGLAVPYNTPTNVGWYEEQMASGVFAKSIKESARSLPLLLWHKSDAFPVGMAVDWREEADGLYGAWELDGSDEAQRAADLAARGYLTGLSVGFTPMPNGSVWEFADDWAPELGLVDRVTRTEARLLEVSLCAAPAYADAGVTLVRTAESRRRTGRPSTRHAETPRLDEWREWRTSL